MAVSSSNGTGLERVELAGTSREIGLQHGRLLAGKIRSQIEVYGNMFLHTSKLDWKAVREVAKEYAGPIERLTPDLYAEMQGIADGAGLELMDIVALNCRSEIALGHFSDGCTSLGWKTQKEGVILAQNWDWTEPVKRNLVLMSIARPGYPKIFMITEAGIVGKIGFNSASVGTCLNAIRAKPTDASKLPIHIALRICLDSRSSSAAIAKLEALGGIASSAHILLADVDDGPRSLELSPRGNVYISPDARGIVCHSNHFIENRHVVEPPWLSGSAARLERIRALTADLADEGTPLTAALLRDRVFADTFNAPQAICCQEDPETPEVMRSSTAFNIITRFVRGEEPSAELVYGRPGSGEEGPVLKMPW